MNEEGHDFTFSSLAERLPDGLVIVDRNSTIMRANNRAHEMLGYGPDELLGLPIGDLIPEVLRPRHAKLHASYQAAPTMRPMGSGRELTARAKDGTEVPIEVSLSPIGAGQVAAFLRDVTLQREIERERENLSRFWESVANFGSEISGNPTTDLQLAFLHSLQFLVPQAEIVLKPYSSTSPESASHVDGMYTNLLRVHIEPDNVVAWVTTASALEPQLRGLIERFTEQAQLILDVATLRKREQRNAVIEDRQRIARDLHDRVIGRLFATGLSLESLMSSNPDPDTRGQIESVVDEIDHSIADLRHSIFSLMHNDGNLTIGALRHLVERTSREKERSGLQAHFGASGPDITVSQRCVDHTMAVLNEAITNAQRHGRCTRLVITMLNDDKQMTLRVHDDGCGFRVDGAVGNGLASMRQRAADLGGSCVVASTGGEGTDVMWSVPVRQTQ